MRVHPKLGKKRGFTPLRRCKVLQFFYIRVFSTVGINYVTQNERVARARHLRVTIDKGQEVPVERGIKTPNLYSVLKVLQNLDTPLPDERIYLASKSNRL